MPKDRDIINQYGKELFQQACAIAFAKGATTWYASDDDAGSNERFTYPNGLDVNLETIICDIILPQQRGVASASNASDQGNQGHWEGAASGLGLGVSSGDHADRSVDCYNSGGNTYTGVGPIGVCGHPDGSNSYSFDSGSGSSGGGGDCIIS